MYTPPKKWEWDKENGGKFSKINRPTSGSTFNKDLPVGKHKLQLYSQGTPNGVKITILLEELLDLNIQEADYDAWLIEISKGDQFSSGFVQVNPNSKKEPELLKYDDGMLYHSDSKAYEKFQKELIKIKKLKNLE